MINDCDLGPEDIQKIDRELQETINVETHPPFLSEEFTYLFMETGTSA